MVSIPIYMSIYGTILCLKEMMCIVPEDFAETFIVFLN